MRYKRTSRAVFLLSLAAALGLSACALTEPAAPRPAAGGSAAFASREEDEQALFDEYREAGIEVRADGLYFQNQRVHHLTDGIGNITRYEHTDPLGTVDVQVVRAQTPWSDGSVELFGPITELHLGDYREADHHSGQFTEDAEADPPAADGGAALPSEAGSEDSSGASGSSIRRGHATEPDGRVATAIEEADSSADDAARHLRKLAPFGITFEELDGGIAIWLNGQKLSGLLDEGPGETIFYSCPQAEREPLAVVAYDADGQVTAVIRVPASGSSS